MRSVSKKSYKGVQVSELDYGSFLAVDMNRIETKNPVIFGKDILTCVDFYAVLVRNHRNGNSYISEMERTISFYNDLPSEEEMVRKLIERTPLRDWIKGIELITLFVVDKNKNSKEMLQDVRLPKHTFNYEDITRRVQKLEEVRLNLPNVSAKHFGWWKYE